LSARSARSSPPNVVETGSFLYTTTAIEHNAENALVLWNVQPIATRYTTEFIRMWAESQ
jgi:hypothetical protein